MEELDDLAKARKAQLDASLASARGPIKASKEKAKKCEADAARLRKASAIILIPGAVSPLSALHIGLAPASVIAVLFFAVSGAFTLLSSISDEKARELHESRADAYKDVLRELTGVDLESEV